MKQTFEAIETPAGIISGRDAIFLDEVKLSLNPATIELIGELNRHLCSKFRDGDTWIKYSLKFLNVLAYSMTELDFRDHLGVSNFDRVNNSEWLRDFRQRDHSSKVKQNHQHFILFTYDDVFDIVSESFEMTLLESRSARKDNLLI